MKFSKTIVAAAMLSATALVAMPADAGGRGHGHGWRHGGHHHGHHHHSHGYGRAGAFIGGAIVAGALLSPWYYPPSYYYRSYPAVVEVTPAPTVYIEQPATYVQPAVSDAANWWYYCNDTRAYYPYVSTCASPWQKVAPTPAPATPR